MSNLLKSKIVLGFMIVAVLLVGVVAFMPKTSNAADCTITQTLRQGMKGADVICLQSKLGLASTYPTGYFGSVTKGLVVAFQKANPPLVADGIVGVKTREILMTAQTNGTPTADLCPNGMTLASNCLTAPTTTPTGALCPNGNLLSNNCAAAGTTGTTFGTGKTDGSLTASRSSYVSSGLTLKKGDTKNVAALHLQATVGPVQVSRMNVDFNLRPWLYFSTVTLSDSTGKVLATKTLTGPSDVNEITVGSNYQIAFDGLNYVVTPGTNVDLVVGVTVLGATDKILNNQVVYATIPSNSLKTINEMGWTDSTGGTDVGSIGTWAASTTGLTALNGTGDSSFLLSSTGSIAAIYDRISPSSPATGQQVISATQATNDVVLGVFSLKSTNTSATLNSLVVNVVNGTGTTASVVSNVRLINGSTVVGGVMGTDNGPGSTAYTFSNMSIPLTQDAWTDFTVKADIAMNVSGTIYTVLDSSTITATDSSYNTATISTTTDPSSNLLTLTANAITVSGATASLGSAIVQSNSTVGYNANYAFTLTNNSNNDMYVSQTPGIVTAGTAALATYTITSSGGTTTGTGLGSVYASVSPSTVNGDDLSTDHVYAIPAGTSRTFTFAGAIYDNTAANSVTLAISQINYGIASATPTALHLTTGLSGLQVTAHF